MPMLLLTTTTVGILLAIQASVNPRLARAVGTPYGGAAVQLWIAVALLFVAAVLSGGIGALARVAEAPWWYLLGGLASPLYITSGILLFPRIGALAAGGLFIAGQVLSSVLIDALGLFGSERRVMDVGVIGAIVTVLLGIVVIVRAQRPGATGGAAASPSSSPSPASPPPDSGRSMVRLDARASSPLAPRLGGRWIAVGLAAGAVLPIQGAINAELRTVLLDPLAVSLSSFTVAAASITLLLGILLATGRTSPPRMSALRDMPWWGWLGAVCAVAYVTGTFLLIPTIGAATTIVLTVTGQQIAGAVIDSSGAFGLARRRLTAMRVLGLGLLIAGSALIELL